MRRRAKLTIEIPRWVDDEDDLIVHLCAEDACLERARAIRAGARRHPPARLRWCTGAESFRRARDRSLSTAKRVSLLLRAERVFVQAGDLALCASRSCYERTGLGAAWTTLVKQVRTTHRRKFGFVAGFEKIVAGEKPRREPSFLQRAKRRGRQ